MLSKIDISRLKTNLSHLNNQKKRRILDPFQTSLSYSYDHCSEFVVRFISFGQVSTATLVSVSIEASHLDYWKMYVLLL